MRSYHVLLILTCRHSFTWVGLTVLCSTDLCRKTSFVFHPFQLRSASYLDWIQICVNLPFTRVRVNWASPWHRIHEFIRSWSVIWSLLIWAFDLTSEKLQNIKKPHKRTSVAVAVAVAVALCHRLDKNIHFLTIAGDSLYLRRLK